ncbi:hypothetical protein D4764_20G0003610 [Takifugu flavidus]|uniref:Uncharacterized protein n=1 Tax=Takifugu flavidus TaxID=433684 RepID=A0A5C6NI77_9TELE|nr:hypothetical protein D4764_20G0003610 [Takifugu flavidus]
MPTEPGSDLEPSAAAEVKSTQQTAIDLLLFAGLALS